MVYCSSNLYRDLSQVEALGLRCSLDSYSDTDSNRSCQTQSSLFSRSPDLWLRCLSGPDLDVDSLDIDTCHTHVTCHHSNPYLVYFSWTPTYLSELTRMYIRKLSRASEYNIQYYRGSLHGDCNMNATSRMRLFQLGVIGNLCRHNRGRKVLKKGMRL
jgi:hypothetical protein